MFVTAKALRARARLREVFEEGEYIPLESSGAQRQSLFAFARVLAGTARVAIACVPRLIASLIPGAGGPPVGATVWGDTQLLLPPLPHISYTNVFTGASIEPTWSGNAATIAARTLFDRFPVALLVAGT
jgi:(1->4)-alpha-D-glucan 1-alpha-D-glucosylmutase